MKEDKLNNLEERIIKLEIDLIGRERNIENFKSMILKPLFFGFCTVGVIGLITMVAQCLIK
jgi:hypothetical protein